MYASCGIPVRTSIGGLVVDFKNCEIETLNPLPTVGNSLTKQKSLYKVLTPGIKPLMGLWELMTHMRHWLVKG